MQIRLDLLAVESVILSPEKNSFQNNAPSMLGSLSLHNIQSPMWSNLKEELKVRFMISRKEGS